MVFFLHGQIRFEVALPMGLGVLIGAQGVALLSRRMESKPIRRLLAGAVAVFGVWLVLRTLLG